MSEKQKNTGYLKLILLFHSHKGCFIFFEVRITSLHVNKNTLEKIRTGEVTRSVRYEVGEQRPWFSYSKPMNYLKKEDRNELVQALLYINTMQKKYEIE